MLFSNVISNYLRFQTLHTPLVTIHFSIHKSTFNEPDTNSRRRDV